MTLNDPDLLALLAGLHDAYERALAANDVETLNAFFWDSPHVVRYGVAEQLYGAGDLHAYRQGHTPRFTSRRLVRREVAVFGEDCASIMSEFELVVDGHPRPNRQSQTWVKFPTLGWRIVAAHVSSPLVIASAADAGPAWSAYVDAMARVLELPLAAAHRPGVIANLARTAAIVTPLLIFPLPADAEPAPVFAP